MAWPVSAARSFDLAGATLGTGAILALIYGIIRTEPLGRASAEVAGSLAVGAVLLALFVVVGARSSAPLVPLRLFRSRTLSQSTLVLALNGGAFLAMFFLTAIFLQQGKGLTALETGLQFLPMGVAAIVGALVAAQLLPRFGTRPVQIVAALTGFAGLLLLTRASADGAYVTELLPGFVLYGAERRPASSTPATRSAVRSGSRSSPARPCRRSPPRWSRAPRPPPRWWTASSAACC